MRTISEFFELTNEQLEEWNIYITVGPENNASDELVVFDCWSDLYATYGIINGFHKQLGDKPYTGSKTLEDYLVEVRAEFNELGPDSPIGHKHRVQRKLDDTLTWIEFNKYMEDREEVTFDDFGLVSVFSDEYSKCCCCYDKVVRTSPDCYQWTPPLFLEAEGYVCDECAPQYSEEVLETYANEQRSIPDQFDIDDLGLVKINDEELENGWYGGQCDEPQPIIDALNEADIDVWFKVYPCQFQISFDVYVREADESKARNILSGTDYQADEDPAVVLERGLKAASKAIGELNGDGVKHATIDTSDGTVEARVVSAEDFVKNGLK